MFLWSADDMSSGRGADDMSSGRGADDTSSGRGADDMSSRRGADDMSSRRGMHVCMCAYVSLRLRVQNAVPTQPCVGKY